MNLRDMLEQKKRSLSIDYGDYGDYGYDYDYTMENMGDITGEENYGYGGYDNNYDDADYNSYLGFDRQDILDIEASLIEDPDQYIDDATEEFNNGAIGLAGELYMDDLIVEEALFECTTFEELSIVEESIKDTIREKADKAVNYIKELWKKFKAWIKNLVQVIINMFTSGAKLVEKYKSTIEENWAKRGSQIRVKCYQYKLDESKASQTVNDILDYTKAIAIQGSGKIEGSAGSAGARNYLGDTSGKEIDKELGIK